MKKSGKDAIVGIDVGGTKIQAGIINIDGDIIYGPVTYDTGASDDSEKIYERISGSVNEAINLSGLQPGDIVGIGMGVTGPLDTQNGIILECPQLPTMHFYPLREKICEKFQLPVFMDNDANALLLGESIWGAGNGYRTILGFTLGTGLGCAIVVDKKLFTGTNGLAGEVWPSPYTTGTIEDIVSGRGVSATYFRLTDQLMSSKEIAILARQGDKNALETWSIFGTALGNAVAWGINIIDPGIVIMGGSIANSLDLFYDQMNNTLRKYICPVPAEKTKVVKALLGDNAGFIGAAALVIPHR